MAYSDLADNQCVSFTNAQSSGITQLHALPTLPDLMTKDEAIYYLDINASYLAAYPGYRWVRKGWLVANSYSLATLTTAAVSSIGDTTATGGGNISSDGGAAVTERGICWSTSSNPTTSNSKATSGSGTGSFSAGMTGLSQSTTYYVRAYAINSVGTAYGSQVSFTTAATLYIPSLTTYDAYSIIDIAATSGGDISSDGGASITEKGVCWNTSGSPTTSSSKAVYGSGGTASFSIAMSVLTQSTTYYVRAYAINSVGTAYGNQISFTTLSSVTTPTLTTTSISAITPAGASSGGNVTGDGGAAVTARGIVWGTSQNPTLSNNVHNAGSGTGSFSATITTASASTTYYVRAFATNSAGTAYGSQVSFTTLSGIAAVSTGTPPITIADTSAYTFGIVTSDGGSAVTARGICWSTSSNPTTSSNVVSSGSGTGTFYATLTGLSPSTLIHMRAYATNAYGTVYGSDVTFTTNAPSPTLPSISTDSCYASYGAHIVVAFTLSDWGNGAAGSWGIQYCSTSDFSTGTVYTEVYSTSTTPGYTSQSYHTLSSNVVYVRAFATSGNGTSYGSTLSVNTLPDMTLDTPSSVTGTSAYLSGSIASYGSAYNNIAITASGICWSSTNNPTIYSNLASLGSTISGLTPGTTYYVRVYATTALGTSYSNQQSFTTTAVVVPTVVTTDLFITSPYSIECGGYIASDGGGAITARGLCWGTSPNPTISGNKTSDSGDPFSSSLSGLNKYATYYVRAYATNSAGTGYGGQESFTGLYDYPYPWMLLVYLTIPNPTDLYLAVFTTNYGVGADCVVRIVNTTQNSFPMDFSFYSSNGESTTYKSTTLTDGFTSHYAGDSFSIAFSRDGGSTWSGYMVYDNALVLEYDFSL